MAGKHVQLPIQDPQQLQFVLQGMYEGNMRQLANLNAKCDMIHPDYDWDNHREILRENIKSNLMTALQYQVELNNDFTKTVPLKFQKYFEIINQSKEGLK